MEMTGEFRIPAPRQRVWEGLNDPEILKSSIPGCQTIEKLSDTAFTAKVLAQVGPVKANFAGKVTLADLNPPQSYTIAGEGTGGVAGFAKGSAKVNLDEDGGATVLHYAVQAHVGGKLAQIGSRLIDSVARFHLGNGARLERINWLGDTSAKGLRESAGIMVNYLYRLEDIEKNHEAYANQGTVAASSAVRKQLKNEGRRLLDMRLG